MAVTTDFLKGILEEFQSASSNLLPWDKSQLPSALAAKQLDAGGSGGSGGATAGDIGDAVDDALRATPLPVSAASLPLPSGAATEATLGNILTQLQGDRAIASQLFIDATNTIYLRVLAYNQQTNGYESTTVTLAGGAYTPTAPETPLERSDFDTTQTDWEIVTSGAGYTIGDIVAQFTLITQGPPVAVAAVLWFNQTTQAAISAPVAGHRRRIGAAVATEATLGQLRDRLPPDRGVRAAANALSTFDATPAFPIIATPHGAGAVFTAGIAATQQQVQIVDLNSLAHRGEISIGIVVTGNATSPGTGSLTLRWAYTSDTTVTPDAAWANSFVSGVVESLSVDILNTVSQIRRGVVWSRPTARYLTLWLDVPARAASSQLTVVTRVVQT